MQAICSECRHYEAASDEVGNCLESSPQVIVRSVEVPDEEGTFSTVLVPVSLWPQVTAASRCGQWAPRPATSALRVVPDGDDL